MSINMSRSDLIRWEIKVEDGREVTMDLRIHRVADGQRSQIEEAARTFHSSVMEILKDSLIP